MNIESKLAVIKKMSQEVIDEMETYRNHPEVNQDKLILFVRRMNRSLVQVEESDKINAFGLR